MFLFPLHVQDCASHNYLVRAWVAKENLRTDKACDKVITDIEKCVSSNVGCITLT